MVVTSEDYFESQTIRKGVYDCIKSEAQACTTLFVGYSLEDYTFKNMFYALYTELGKWTKRSYSVSPDANQLRYQWKTETMREYCNTSLVNDNFDTFMLRLVLARGHLHPKLKQLVQDSWAIIESDNSAAMGSLVLNDVLALPDTR